jgi:hypothetical protein
MVEILYKLNVMKNYSACLSRKTVQLALHEKTVQLAFQ